MRSRKLSEGVNLARIILTLPVVLTFNFAGCVWIPDFVHPSPHFEKGQSGQQELESVRVMKEAMVKKIPFAILRTIRMDGDTNFKAEFTWEAKGWADWFGEFGFGSTATYMRFVLFGPDGSIICGNEWQKASVVTQTCILTKDLLGKAMSADIDYTRADNPPGETDFYESVGRMFYFADKGKTGASNMNNR